MAMNQIIRYKTIIDYIKKNKPKKILEVWSWSKWIWKFMKNINFTWLDKTTSDYSSKENKVSKNMKYIDWDCLRIPFKDNDFDFVFSLDMLEHLKYDDRIKAIDEIIRVWKISIIAFPYWKFWTLLDKLLYEYNMEKNWKVEWRLKEHIENWLPDEDFINLIKNRYNNLKIEEINNWNIYLLILVLYLEWVRIVWFIINSLSYLIKFTPIKFDSKYWVRKYLIIKK